MPVEGPRRAGSTVPAGLLSGLGAARLRHRQLRLQLRLLVVGVGIGRVPALERTACRGSARSDQADGGTGTDRSESTTTQELIHN